MGKGKKVAIITIPIVVILFLLVIAGSGPYVNKDVTAISGIGNFVVLEQGSQYVARFSLVDAEMGPAAADVNVKVKVGMSYEDEFVAPASEFKVYKLQLTGQEFVAYAWNLPEDFYGPGSSKTAIITVTLPDGRELKADTRVF